MGNSIKKLFFAAALMCLAGPRWGFAAQRTEGGQLFNETALAYSTTTTGLNVEQLNNLSMQAVWSSATIAAVSISDGRKSTATITVSNNNALAATRAGFTVTVASNNPVGGTTLTIGTPLANYKFKSGPGGNWAYVDTSSNSCQALAAAINADPSGLFIASCPFVVAAGTVCFASSTVAGSFANSWTVTSSSPPALSTGSITFLGGFDNARVAINGVTLTQGTDWTVATQSSMTAKAISDAANARSGISSVIITTAMTNGVIFATATTVGVNAYAIFTSTSGALNLNGSFVNNSDTFNGGLASNIVASTFTKNNALTLGLPVLFSTVAAAVPPQNLTNQTTYYIIKIDATNFKLASSQANALAGTNIIVSTFNGNGFFNLTPLAFTGSSSFKFQISNDNTNWTDLSVSSVSYICCGAGSSSYYDLLTPSYRYIRANEVGPTTGGWALTISANGRQN